MLNMLDTQDKLKNFSEAQLIKEMQMPSGSAPQFMVLSEIERRKRMRSDVQRQEGLMQPTVAQEAVSAAGVPQQGIAQVAQSMAPKTDMTQNTGVPNVQAAGLPAQPNQPQRMADGGIMRLAPGGQMSGGTLSAIASLKVTNPDIYEKYKDDPRVLAQMAKAFLEVAEDPEMTTLEALEAPSTSFKTSNFRDNVAGGLKTFMQRRKDDKEFGEDYSLDQRRQSINAVREAEKDPNSMLFDEGSNLSSKFAVEEALPFNRMADPSSRYQSRLPSAGFQRERTDINASGDPSETGSTGVFTNASGDPSETSTSDPLAYSAERARRAYLAGNDYNESDVPAIVDMLNRGREFQQSDTYTPPEQVYTDLGANSPLGGLKYTMDGASEDEQAEMFAQYSDRLGVERGIAHDIREQEAYAAADNNRRIAGDAMDEDVAMEQGLEGPRFRNKIGKQEVQVQGGLGLGQTLNPNTIIARGTEYLKGVGETLNPNTIIARGTEYLKGVDERTKKTQKKAPNNIGRFNAAESQGNAMGAAAEVFTPPNPYEIKMQKKKDGAELAKRLADEDSVVNNSGLAAIKKSVKKTSPSTDDGKQTFKSTAQNMNEDKWLALAQAGLTLMSTGDFGKAGSAGLAALRESKKTDLAERKIRSDEAFNEARIEAAKKGKPIPGALITSLSKELLQLQDAYSLIADTAYDSYFGLGNRVDPDRAERTRLENKIKEIRRRLEFAYRSHGMGSNADASPQNEQYNVVSKEE